MKLKEFLNLYDSYNCHSIIIKDINNDIIINEFEDKASDIDSFLELFEDAEIEYFDLIKDNVYCEPYLEIHIFAQL